MVVTTQVGTAESLAVADNSLELYVAYDYLLATQFTGLARAVVGLHGCVLQAARETHDDQLFVDSIDTGQSIRVKFRQGQLIPKLEFPEDDLVVALPRWSAGIFLAGGILIGGAAVLEAGDIILEHLTASLEVSAEVIAQQYNIDVLRDPGGPTGRDARRYLTEFYQEASATNLRRVEVNGAVVWRREDEERVQTSGPARRRERG